MTVPIPSCLFLALDTYSSVGGLQHFNQRIISALAALAKDNGAPAPRVRIMGDQPENLPKDSYANIRGFGRNRLQFIFSSLKAAFRPRVLLIGQLNLLPVAWLLKHLNPKLKTILFVHGIEVWNDPVYRSKRAYEPFLFKSIDLVASVSRYTGLKVNEHFGVPMEKIVVFPNAVDGPVATTPIRNRLPQFLVVTRLAEHDRGKNVDAVIRALALVKTSIPDVRLDIVGDGVLRQELEHLAQALGVENHVTFHGRISDQALEACYKQALAFVLPSSKEGFGIVYLEAWKHGLPVICGNEAAPPEIISHDVDGFIADPADAECLAGFMKLFAKNPGKGSSMGAAGARKVASHYLDQNFRHNLNVLLQTPQ